jgi:UDP:flavonoid glycosyltransferase YjiC (YdhE family)
MAKVLFGWEFGSGLGHLTRMLAIAEGMRAAGHRCVLALSQPASARSVLARFAADDPRISVVQAPFWTAPPQGRDSPTWSLADALQLFRYGDPSLLSVMARAWRGLFTEVRADLVVIDFAPTLNLAVGGACPVVALGNGYTVPPAGRRLPPIRPWQTDLPSGSVKAESDIIDAVNSTRAQFKFDPVPFLADLFSGTKTFVCTIAELDPYATYRSQSYLRPFNHSPMAGIRPIDHRPAKSVFLYLPASHRFLSVTLEAIAALELDCRAYVANLPSAIRHRFGSSRIRFHANPQPLGSVLPAVRVVVHHGGLSTAYSALCAATPQLVLPHQLEHLVTSYGLGRLGVAAVFSASQKPGVDDVADALRKLLETPRFHNAARSAAISLDGARRADPVATVVEECVRLAGSAAR